MSLATCQATAACPSWWPGSGSKAGPRGLQMLGLAVGLGLPPLPQLRASRGGRGAPRGQPPAGHWVGLRPGHLGPSESTGGATAKGHGSRETVPGSSWKESQRERPGGSGVGASGPPVGAPLRVCRGVSPARSLQLVPGRPGSCSAVTTACEEVRWGRRPEGSLPFFLTSGCLQLAAVESALFSLAQSAKPPRFKAGHVYGRGALASCPHSLGSSVFFLSLCPGRWGCSSAPKGSPAGRTPSKGAEARKATREPVLQEGEVGTEIKER